jgi:hypothetical protein
MSNLLIETSAIKTFPKSSSLKHSLGSFCTPSSSPFPKARSLKQSSLKRFVLRLFGKFVLLSPTLMGYRRFHFTHKVGPWTLLTSNPYNASSAVLKTGGNGGWLTAVARWHMRYFQRWVSWRRERVSSRNAHSFALRVARCLAVVVHRAPCIVWYHCVSSSRSSSSLSRTSSARALQLEQPHPPLHMSSFFHRIIRHGQDLIGRVVGTRGYAWAHPLFVEAGAEIHERACLFAIDWTIG